MSWITIWSFDSWTLSSFFSVVFYIFGFLSLLKYTYLCGILISIDLSFFILKLSQGWYFFNDFVVDLGFKMFDDCIQYLSPNENLSFIRCQIEINLFIFHFQVDQKCILGTMIIFFVYLVHGA